MITANLNVGTFQFKLKEIDRLLVGSRIPSELQAPVELIYKNAVYNTLGATGNNGVQWKPRKPQLTKNGIRKDTHRLLQKTGFMRNTTKAQSAQNSITVSTQADYAKYHITGTRRMVARPTNGVDPKIERVISATVANIINSITK